jgi:hypothetical protein
VTAGATVDLGAPAGLLVALLLVLAARLAGRGRPALPVIPPRPALLGMAGIVLLGLWAPGLLGAALSPLAATVAALAGDLLVRSAHRSGHQEGHERPSSAGANDI